MKYLLDTNICIHFFKGKYNLIDKFLEIGIENCAISEITLAELTFGADNSQDPAKNHQLIETLVDQISVLPMFSAIPIYGKQKANLRKRGIMISDFDLLIGCTAIESSLVMVTENVREFSRIEGIKIENWILRS
jgi:tRNA(fMet)-specific endonuclease VapC